MIGESKSDRLDEFKRALEAEGYDVVSVETQHRQTISEKIEQKDDGTLGFVGIETPVEIRGEVFDGQLVITVHEDRLSNHGVDIRSSLDDPLPEDKQNLLDQLVSARKVTDEDGETQLVWTYYPPPRDLPDTVIKEPPDNIHELIAEFESIYKSVL